MNYDALHKKIEAVLPRVEKPNRYLGNEINAVRKPEGEIDVRVALVFPEVYEIGMSWPGQQILYNLLNTKPGVAAERCYAFWPDMEQKMREMDIPAFSLETWTPLTDFDILGFTLQHELVFTNILTVLDLAGVPLRTAERRDDHPLILAGGPVAYNCEPMADFLDAVVLGDGEDVFLEICDVYREWKDTGQNRTELLRRLSKLEGVYIPSFYEIETHDEPVPGWSMPALKAITPKEGAPASVRRRWVEDLNRVPFPDKPLVPLGKTVHSRMGIEVQRGCTRACRFCQAGYIYRPERQRDPETVKQIVAKSLESTGHDEISLLSLSIGDYGCLDPLLGDILGPNPRQTSNLGVSLPSIRVDTLTENIVKKIAGAKRSGFTMAPEAGSPRLREVINKRLTEEQIAKAAELVFQQGYTHIKFYYIIGLPTETDDDVMGIVRTARMCQEIGRKYTKKADVVVSTSIFVPKPFTPFQWEPQASSAEMLRKQQMLKDELAKTRLSYRWHESKESYLEAVLSRGDRRLCEAVEAAWRKGSRFEGWGEHFNLAIWQEAFQETGIEPDFYAHRRYDIDEVLGWEHIDCGVTKEWLQRDYESGIKAKFVPDCATGRCYDCGVCDFEVVKNRTYLSKESGYIPQDMKSKGTGEHPYVIATEGGTQLSDLRPGRADADTLEVHRYRVRYAKEGRAIYLSHLDLLENFQRALTRAGVRLAYSQGFKPKPKISFGPALMTGAISRDEYFDMDVLPPLPAEDFLARVNEGMPDGMEIVEFHPIQRKTASLGVAITGAAWEVTERIPGTLPPREERAEAVERFLASERVEFTNHKGKTYNVREFVMAMETTDDGLRFETSMSPAGSAKPTEVVCALFGWENPRDTDTLQFHKTSTHFQRADTTVARIGELTVDA